MIPRRYKKISDLIGSKMLDQKSIIHPDEKIYALHIDSRNVESGSLFAALSGVQTDGHKYIDSAIEKGARAILCEQLPSKLRPNISYLKVQDSAQVIGVMASTFFDNPSHHLKLVGVTGTNGKTTIATLLYQLYSAMNFNCGLISTVENRIKDQILPSTHTTPDSIHLQQLLFDMVEEKCAYVFMEVSSHAIHQQRISGCKWNQALFTNLTHDHLDYHGSFSAYRDVKKCWFDHLDKQAKAIVNADDKNGLFMVQNTSAHVVKYGISSAVDYRANFLAQSSIGMEIYLNQTAVHVQLKGHFNIYNICATYAAAIEDGLDESQVLIALSTINGAPGRLQTVQVSPDAPLGIVDYAHTPDALENVLKTVRKMKNPSGQIITIVGCGGDRDPMKRPVMARIAAHYSDKVWITSDNPRTENIKAIISEMMDGLNEIPHDHVETESDRKIAINKAVRSAGKEDIILVAGKGHEKYQEIMGVRHPFDDVTELRKAMLL